MRILCFDTSLDKTYIAIGADNDFVQREIKSDENNYHSAYLIPEIKELTAKTNITLDSLDAIVTNSGPGSFTGIRAGLSVAKVMALELNLPVVSLNSCEILQRASNIKNAVVLLDARRLMYYFYRGSEIELVLKDAIEPLIKNKTVICDSGVQRDFDGLFGCNFINYEEQNYQLASVMYNLGREKLALSKNIEDDFEASKLKANYIQTPPVFKK